MIKLVKDQQNVGLRIVSLEPLAGRGPNSEWRVDTPSRRVPLRMGDPFEPNQVTAWQKRDPVVTHETESNRHQRLPAASCKIRCRAAFVQVMAMNGDQRTLVATVLVQG